MNVSSSEIIDQDNMDLTCSDGVGGRPAANNERRPPPRAIIARVLCARCVRKSAASANHRAGRRQPAAGQARSIRGPQGQANSPHHRFQRSLCYRPRTSTQLPTDSPLFRAPRRLAAAWSPCVAGATPCCCCCCFAHDSCLLSAALSSAATHSPRPTLD
jgi:hypothetical protein